MLSHDDASPTSRIDPDEREENRQFITMLILTSIGYRVLDPRQNIAEIRAEAYRNGVPVKATMEAWQERLQRFKKYLLQGEDDFLEVKANRKNTTVEELELFREIAYFITYEDPQTGQRRVLDQATLDQFRAGLRLRMPRPGAPASGKKSQASIPRHRCVSMPRPAVAVATRRGPGLRSREYRHSRGPTRMIGSRTC